MPCLQSKKQTTYLQQDTMSATMSNYTAIYSDVLETGREKMNEGDYLKLAEFLSSLHKTKEQVEIVRKTDKLIDITTEFNTNKGKHYDVKIDKCHIVVYRGHAKPNDYIINGSINGEEFTMEKDELITKFKKIILVYGMKNIKQTLEDNEPEEHKTFKKFKTHCEEVDRLLEYDSDEDYEDIDNPDWYIACLFGINYEILN